MKWTKKEIPIKELATGEMLHLNLHTLHGEQPGPHIHIQASVHGAELQGNAVILKLMEKLNKLDVKGSIAFIPLANPYATNNKHGTYTYGRYNPVTGDNWNRNYRDVIKASEFDIDSFAKQHLDEEWDLIKSEFKLALKNTIDKYTQDLIYKKLLAENNKLNLLLQHLASTADGVLDLHTGPVATRYLYAAEYEEEVAYYLKFKHILLIPNEFGGAMDEAAFMPWIHLKDAFKKLGRDIDLDVESFTLEFGSEETFDMDNAEKDVESILNYLRFKGVLPQKAQKNDASACLLKNYKTIYSPQGGLVDYKLSPGERFKAGDIIAEFYHFKNLDPNDPIASTKSEVIADYDGIIINRCPSSSVHQGMELYQVMTDLKEYKA